MTSHETSITGRLVSALVEASRDVPPSALHSAKRMILDGTACAVAGSADVQYEPVARYASSFAAHGAVPGPLGRTYDVATATYLTGAAAHILDFDDVQTTMGGHPSSTLLPVVLALGSALGVSGPEALRAVVIGAELEARIGRSMNPSHYSVGWHPTSVIGCLGASMAASLLLELDVEITSRALGIAASYSAGTKANFGTTTKSLHAGIAARAGVESALLAERDATGNDSILDDQFGGYFNLYTPEVDRDSLLEGIGQTFVVDSPGVSFKLLPCCGSIHSSVWAVIGLYEEGGYQPSEIASIRAFVDPKRITHTSRVDVTNGLEAKFSSQYCQAVAALTGQLTLSDFDDDAVMRPERQELLRRVSVLPAADSSEWANPDDSYTGSRGALVEIEDGRGDVVRKFNLVPRGYAADPASDDVLLAKFADCVSRDGRSPEEVGALGTAVMSLENVADVGEITSMVWRSGSN